jgi:hypothetical protein
MNPLDKRFRVWYNPQVMSLHLNLIVRPTQKKAMSRSLTTEYPFSRYVPAAALTGERLGNELEPSYGVERASPTIGLLPMDAR